MDRGEWTLLLRACLWASTVNLSKGAVFEGKMMGEARGQLCIKVAGMPAVTCHTASCLLVTQHSVYLARAEGIAQHPFNTESRSEKKFAELVFVTTLDCVGPRVLCESVRAGRAVSNGCCIIAEMMPPHSSLKPTITTLRTAPSFDYTATITVERSDG